MAAVLVVAIAGGCGGEGETCVQGQSVACTCAGGSAGAAVCTAAGMMGACECAGDGGVEGTDAAGPDAAPCVASEEVCDGADNDCDDVADDGEVCPAGMVQGTQPFTAGLYLVGTLSPGACDADAIQRFWPTVADEYITNLPCSVSGYDFRPGDGRLLYHEIYTGVYVDVDPDGDEGDELIRTPPCGTGTWPPFGFDGEDTLHYRCDDTLRRADGELIRFPISFFVATLADGRVLTMEGPELMEDIVVSDRQGHELSRVPPHDAFGGPLAPVFRGTTVDGNRAYVLFLRTLEDDTNELVAFALDEDSRWTQMRRLPLADLGRRQIVISDGTVFVRGRDPEVVFNDRIVAYHPDGSEEIVWREVESDPVKSHSEQEMMTGPP